MSDELHITHRHLPHWQLKGSFYFVTFRTKEKLLSDSEKELLLDHIIGGNGRYYKLYIAVVLEDHAHIIIKPQNNISLSRILHGIKGASSRKINKLSNSSGPLWQAESYDRIIRNDTELIEKANYILFNPVRLGLIENPWKYRFLYFSEWLK